MKALSDEACGYGWKSYACPGKQHTQRLNKIASALGDNINGQPVNYKVYMAKDVNAFAMANGCIRVYSGLMDMMTDNEVEAVIGHEMGHVALGHVKKGMQVALGTNAVRAAAASAGGIVGSLSQSQLGDVGEKLVNSQFSQRQESEADDYSYDLLRKRGINPSGLATSFENWRNWRKAVKAPCLTITRPPLNARSISVTAWRQTVLNNTPARCAALPGNKTQSVQRFLWRPGKLKGANLPHPHLYHRRPRHRQRFHHHRVKILGLLNAPGL